MREFVPGVEEAKDKNKDKLKSIFQQARKDLYFPPLNMEFANIPAIQLDLTTPKYRIQVNPRVTELFDDTALRGFFHHELDHWAKHPYDVKTVILEQSWIEEVEENYDKARSVRNLYDDVVVTLDLVINRSLDHVARVYVDVSSDSRIVNLLKMFFEEVTGIGFGKGSSDEQLERKLEQMKGIDFLDTRKIRVRKNVMDFADIVSDLIEEIQIDLPFSDFGIEDFSTKEVQRALTDLAREMDLEEFREIATRTDRWIGITRGDQKPYEIEKPEVDWYVSRAQRHAVYIKPLSAKGPLYPEEIKDFELDDSIDSYSPENSYGKFLPGIAKRYEFEEFESYAESLQDAVIIIDSSGSMKHPDREASYAVIGAFAISRNYLEHGSRVGVINFSGRNLQLNLTRDSRSVYEHLKAYQGSGTTLHLEDLQQYLRENQAEDYVLITDMGFDNLEDVVDFFARVRKRLTIIWIKEDVKEDERFEQSYKAFKQGLSEKVTFIEVEKEEDVPHIVVGKAFVEVYAP